MKAVRSSTLAPALLMAGPCAHTLASSTGRCACIAATLECEPAQRQAWSCPAPRSRRQPLGQELPCCPHHAFIAPGTALGLEVPLQKSGPGEDQDSGSVTSVPALYLRGVRRVLSDSPAVAVQYSIHPFRTVNCCHESCIFSRGACSLDRCSKRRLHNVEHRAPR